MCFHGYPAQSKAGILVSKSLGLTARHVAKEVAARPRDFDLLQTGEQGKRSYLAPLTLVAMIEIGADASGNPDLALIKVSGAYSTQQQVLRDDDLILRNWVGSLGAPEFGLFPTSAPASLQRHSTVEI